MNIIESALQKKQQSGEEEKAAKPTKSTKEKQFESQIDDGVSESNPRGRTQSGNVRRPSVRQNIAAMSQDRVYTPDELNDKGLISASSLGSNLVNEYRNLRTKLLAAGKNKNFVTLVTSVKQDQNTSLIASNLAATFARDSGKTSVLLNADMMTREKMDEIFDVKPTTGLVNFIESEEMPVEDIIYETPIPRLRYIPVGNVNENIGEYYTSTRMEKMITDLVHRYPERYPIINSPSIVSSADARILLGLCDFVILVVPYGECSEDLIRHAADEIGKEKLAGVILDNF